MERVKHGDGIAFAVGDDMPIIVCLCGSTRFRGSFERVNARLTLQGEIVLSCGVWRDDPIWNDQGKAGSIAYDLDVLHKKKINLADYIYIVNPTGYVGESTLSEINYAWDQGKRIEWLVPMHREGRTWSV